MTRQRPSHCLTKHRASFSRNSALSTPPGTGTATAAVCPLPGCSVLTGLIGAIIVVPLIIGRLLLPRLLILARTIGGFLLLLGTRLVQGLPGLVTTLW